MDKDKLLNEKKSGWINISDEEKNKIFSFCDDYIKFMNKSKTEREAVKTVLVMLEEKGFKDINDVDSLKPNDKIYYINREKNVFSCVIGSDSIENGLNLVGSHIDSPRLDLKPNPVYEDNGFAYFKTHYYGGIKKYQWTTIPLSIHGVIVKPDGKKIDISIGEEENDPIFTITDLLPHLSQKQNELKLADAIKGEDLNILVGNMPLSSENGVKEHILEIIKEKYDFNEKDFLSAEIEMVPAFKAKS